MIKALGDTFPQGFSLSDAFGTFHTKDKINGLPVPEYGVFLLPKPPHVKSGLIELSFCFSLFEYPPFTVLLVWALTSNESRNFISFPRAVFLKSKSILPVKATFVAAVLKSKEKSTVTVLRVVNSFKSYPIDKTYVKDLPQLKYCLSRFLCSPLPLLFVPLDLAQLEPFQLPFRPELSLVHHHSFLLDPQ
ncbi:hypothetical protein PAECIP111891_05983 [Paenibacillus allorhizoplanae]|uniref:Uncharacterized protein n=1 Tax=Paenibacillus allorhizoplanae TaxID=2905648 RepID=A0ABM9CWC6_9BACL|nr:hypothetical protein [Paenibacillus allorhizoplanae]CAH1226726.1 hypothetical protein PAECIP111891_05983 [Paenibacillus allorhizoplanae]